MRQTTMPDRPRKTTEARLTRCARCYEDAAGEKGHQMFGLLIDDLGSVPMFSIIREFGRTRLLIRLRLCNACHDEAQAFALANPEGNYVAAKGAQDQ
jgi:hypothetical protein